MLSIEARARRAVAARPGSGRCAPSDPLAHTNTLQQWQFGWGNVDGAAADLVIENDYAFPMVTHFAIEPHAFLAAPDANGVTIWSPTQHPYVLQRVVAAALQWPIARVRIIAPDPGGGFGGKGWPKVEPLMAWLALHARTAGAARADASKRHFRRRAARLPAFTRAPGFASDGRIVFQDIQANFLLGAYADIGARVVSKASYSACGPYRRRARAHRRARAAVAHDAEHGVQRVRHAAGVMGGRIAAERSRRRARDRSRRHSPPQPPGKRRGVQPERHAGRWRVAYGARESAARNRLGRTARAEPRARHLARA